MGKTDISIASMSDNLIISQFVEKFHNGDFTDPDVLVQIEAGWTDWFCSDKALKNKTMALGHKVSQIKDSKWFNKDLCYAAFKNCCTCGREYYDLIQIISLVTDNVLFAIGHQNNKWQLYMEGHWEKPVVEGTWREVKKFFV